MLNYRWHRLFFNFVPRAPSSKGPAENRALNTFFAIKAGLHHHHYYYYLKLRLRGICVRASAD